MTARRKDDYVPAQLGFALVVDRPTNSQLAASFRTLLTEDFYTTYSNGERASPGSRTHNLALAASKPWRAELWRAFAEIERRLCPTKDGGPK